MGLERRPNPLQRWLQWIPSSGFGRWVLPRILHLADRAVYRLTGEKHTLTSLIAGVPVLLLTTRGAKSGALRTVPLVGTPHGKSIILIASNFGQHQTPGWYYNLRAHPEATITVEGHTQNYLAREIQDENEYQRYWAAAVSIYKGYDVYKAVAGRYIPMFILEPQ